MPIDYTFTDRGTIQIECGSEWIEVRLPGGPPPPTLSQGPSDPGVKPAPSALPGNDKSKSQPEPATSPGVMSIVAGVGKPQESDLSALRQLSLPSGEHFDLAWLDGLDLNADQQALLEYIGRTRRRLGTLQVVDVDFGIRRNPSQDVVAKLQALLRKPEYGIDVLRIWQREDPDA
jgi:hypothetical protein